MGRADGFELVTTRMGALPLVGHIADRLGLSALLESALPGGDARVRLASADAVRLVVTNLVLGRHPLYALHEWAGGYDPGLFGLSAGELSAVNDDRIGRALQALFDADRASLLTAVVLTAVREFGIDTTQLHNDSTSISVSGVYRDGDGHTRGGKTTPVITFGHSKDHRPDLKQLVWILTVAADGAVPVAYRLADGNTTDDPTHVPTWDQLVALLGRPDFLYVADSKLCSRTAMGHIAAGHGRFVTVLPRSRAEDGQFRHWLQTHTPAFAEAARSPGARLGEADRVYSTCPAPTPSAEGYRIVWVHSTSKAARDADTRQARIQAGQAAMDTLADKLSKPRCRIHSRAAAEEATAAALTEAGAARWVGFTIDEQIVKDYKQERRGRPGPNTRYREIAHTRYQLTHDIDLAAIAYDAASDGMFPLITNTDLADADVLAAYKYQPNLERRHHLPKSVQDAAPVLLKDPARIEALFCCQFLALLISALLERQVRAGMHAAATAKIPLYPEFRGCPAPSTERILEIFADVTRHELYQHKHHLQTFQPELGTLQLQVLDLLGLPATIYTDNPAQQFTDIADEKCGT